MEKPQAIELAFLIQEYIRISKLNDAIKNPESEVFSSNNIYLTVMEGGITTHPEIPLMFIRTLHERGMFREHVQWMLQDVLQRVNDQYGITLE